MKLEKLKRITIAGTAGAVVLLFVLIAVMLYQMVAIGNAKREIDSIKQEIVQLEEKKQMLEKDIELWQTRFMIEQRARELEYNYSDDQTIGK